MYSNKPESLDKEVNDFTVSVGKVIQHYGAIEFLINAILAKLISDPVIHSNLTKQRVSGRVEVLFKLLVRNSQAIESAGLDLTSLKKSTIEAFNQRNKIAHNPIIVKPSVLLPNETVGVCVIRYSDSGSHEEWIDYKALKTLISKSNSLLLSYNNILSICQNN